MLKAWERHIGLQSVNRGKKLWNIRENQKYFSQDKKSKKNKHKNTWLKLIKIQYLSMVLVKDWLMAQK